MKLSTILMIIGAILGFAILIVFNLFPNATATPVLRIDEVRGSEIYYQQKPYTLNFEQQNRLIEIVNQAVSLPVAPVTAPNSGENKIVIYRFAKPEITLYPIDTSYFQLQENQSSPIRYFQEINTGSLKELIDKSHLSHD